MVDDEERDFTIALVSGFVHSDSGVCASGLLIDSRGSKESS